MTEARVVEAFIAWLAGDGWSVDTAYGQLLRRMRPSVGNVRYALVVPVSLRWAAQRVKPEIRAVLGIDLYVVAEDGAVEIA